MDPKANATDIVFAFPSSVEPSRLRPLLEQLSRTLKQQELFTNSVLVQDAGFMAIDGQSHVGALELEGCVNREFSHLLPPNERHPDLWRPVIVSSLSELEPALRRMAGPRYTYKELDEFTEQLQHRLQSVPQVSKVTRVGVLPEQITLDYSQEKLANAGVSLETVAGGLLRQNVNLPGGQMDVGGRNVTLRTSGELGSERELQSVFVSATAGGTPVRIRDLFEVGREYQSPQLINDYGWYDSAGTFESSRAITLAVSMRSGSQVSQFGAAVDAALADTRALLPPDLVIARTSDQPQQVTEAVSLFNNSLYEAIALVVLVALIGFMSWRTAAILAMAIPVTLAMTYTVMHLIGWDLQQISISTMILALGLLVDVPVVASDAIVSGIAQGDSKREAAWRGPTRLSVAILFATVTNIVAYLPFLAVPDSVGQFIRSLPVVMTIALLSAWLLSMTFVPVFGAALLKAPKRKQPTLVERRQRGFGRIYSAVVTQAIRHRGLAIAIAVLLSAASIPAVQQLKTAFFPKDLSYLSYVDVWAPEDATISQTRELAERAQKVIVATTERYEREHRRGNIASPALKSVTTFVGGGGPRFWFSVTPEQQQPNYAQLVVQVRNKYDTAPLVPLLQKALDEIGGARIDVRQVEMAKPVGIPVAIRITGEDIPTLRKYADRTRQILNQVPSAQRIRDDWGAEALSINLDIDTERAALANVTHQEVANSAAASHGGALIGAVRENDTSIPIVARLRPTERASLSDINNLYVSAARTGQKVPIGQVAEAHLTTVTAKLQRRNHARTITVALPDVGVSSEPDAP
jgi:multidrug efflux pump subunit AcrB